jgi:small subunit ribosomal protein S3
MGQKINPNSFRSGIVKNWPTRWFFRGSYRKYLTEDEAIRNTIFKKISESGIAGIEIERTQGSLRVFIKSARPGSIIGRGGKGIEDLNIAIANAIRKVRKTKSPINLNVNIEELKRTEISANYVAQQIAWDLENRMKFRRTMKKYIEQVQQNKDIKGVKIYLSGRLDGNEIARREWLAKGSIPLQTIRADIDYGTATANTTAGTIGIKVWVYKGDILSNKKNEQKENSDYNNLDENN